jgi:hypothetical protein
MGVLLLSSERRSPHRATSQKLRAFESRINL